MNLHIWFIYVNSLNLWTEKKDEIKDVYDVIKTLSLLLFHTHVGMCYIWKERCEKRETKTRVLII